MGIADRFFKRSQSAAAAAAAAAVANAKFKIGDEVKDQSTGRFGRVRDIDYDGINKRLIYTIETPGSGKMNVAEDDLQLNQVQFPPAFQWGDEVQGVDNPGGNVQEPAAPTKDSLSDRIYDITQNGQPEAYEGELQQLLEQWKQVVGTPQPRFLGGSKSFGIVNKFRKAQQPSPADQFLQAIQKYIQSGNKLFFKGMTNRVFVNFNKIDENTVELAHIHAEIIGQGDGTLALQGINKLADQYGVQIVALVGAIADVHDSFMGDDELVDWYAQQGYVDTEDFEHLMDETDYRIPMTRKPE